MNEARKNDSFGANYEFVKGLMGVTEQELAMGQAAATLCLVDAIEELRTELVEVRDAIRRGAA